MAQLGDLSPQGKVIVGVIVGLMSTSLQSIGLTLQRKSHILEDRRCPYDSHRPPYKRRRWQLGMAMFAISNLVGSTIQITTLPLPVLSALQASGLVFNTAFATLILGEQFTKYSFVGTILVTVGAALIARFGAIGEPAHTLNQLLELLQRRNFIIWIICTGVLIVAILGGCRLLRLLPTSPRTKQQGNLSFQGQWMPIYQSRIRLLRGMSYGFVSGILSAHSLLLAKSAVELLVRTIMDRVNQFNRWQSWMILIAMVSFALTQLFYLHRGLKLCSTSVLYPFVFCFYNITAILDGLIYFRQTSRLTVYHAELIALGTAVLLSGVLCLSWRLEDVDACSGVSAIGPSQSSLGSGMGIMDDGSHLPRESGLDSEGSEEQQPLLQKPHVRWPFRQRAPSLPLISPLPSRTLSTLNMDPESIWAELDDSDYCYLTTKPQSPLSYNAFSRIRPRSKSGTYGTSSVFKRVGQLNPDLSEAHHSAGPMAFRAWDTHRTPPSNANRLRRIFTSATDSHPAPQKHRIWTPFVYRYEPIKWTPDAKPAPVSDDGPDNKPRDCPSPTTASATTSSILNLAGSRNFIISAWRNGLRYLSLRSDTRPGQSSAYQEGLSDNPVHRDGEQLPNDTSADV